MAEADLLLINLLREECGALQSPYSNVSRLFRRHPAIQWSRAYHSMVDDSVAALMEHHSRRVLDFAETKTEKTLDERIVAASYIKTCESMVQRIQGAICQAEKLG